jgi:hypothetical protein
MVHDVVHERFLRHGPAFYRERNRRAREALSNGEGDADALADDLGVGLDSLGEHAEAVRVMRRKLASQQMRGLTGRALYTSYANLGTFLIHGNFKRAVAGDADGLAELKEGLSFIRKSIEVNPEAHFGREEWQARAVEFLLEASARPAVLLERDLIGNSLPEAIFTPRDSFTREVNEAAIGRIIALSRPDKHISPLDRARIRGTITRVGKDGQKMPFDEPVLGIIGMWHLGGGANPHFALALGETMLRVGQRYIAWCAYERAVILASRFWPDAAIRDKFIKHCRRRQHNIEQQLPEGEAEELRTRFEAELAFGQRMQREYHEYEEEQIAAGKFESNAAWQGDFKNGRGEVATRPGPEEHYVLEWEQGAVTPSYLAEAQKKQPQPWLADTLGFGVLTAGASAFAVALWRYWRASVAQAVPPGPVPAGRAPTAEFDDHGDKVRRMGG